MPAITWNTTAANCPPIQVPATLFDVAASNPRTSQPYVIGQTSGTVADLNENAARQDVDCTYGGGSGAHSVIRGLDIAWTAGFSVTVSAGYASIEGLVNLAAAAAVPVTDNASNHVWMSRLKVFLVQLTAAAPPSGEAYVYLGRVVMAGGTCTIIDRSGVVDSAGGLLRRRTADTSAPTDTPPATVQIATRTADGLYWWDGWRYWEIDSGSATTVSVKDYGAKGDGTTDDTAAIQAALAAVTGAGTVLFPAGTYIISPTGTAALFVLRSGMTIQGEGPASVLKVKNNAGNFEQIFGAATDATLVENVTFRDFKVDQNPAGNTTCDITATVSGRQQRVIRFGNFNGVTVDNVRFDPISGVNTVMLFGATSKNACVRDCYFRFVKGATTSAGGEYDNSAVYFDCEKHQATGCQFEAEIDADARGCIESHNGASVVSGNTSRGYRDGVNVVTTTGTLNRPRNDITVVGNSFTRCNNGVSLWATPGLTLSNVTVAGNTIDVANADHALDHHSGVRLFYSTTPDYSGSFENIVITGNVLSFQDDSRAVSEGSCYGIGLAPKGSISYARVEGNLIRNAPIRGIRVGNHAELNACKYIQVQHNTIIDAGHNTAELADVRAAIILESNLTDVLCTENVILDTGATFRGYGSIYARSSSLTPVRVTIRDNVIQAVQGGFKDRVEYGISGLETAETVRNRYVSAWPPASGAYETTDFVQVRRTGAEEGSMSAYKVSSAGSYGTLAGVTATTTVGSANAVLNTTAGLAVGDYISIAGIAGRKKIVQITGSTIEAESTYATAVAGAAVSFSAPTTEQYAPRETFKAAAPASGTWARGDRVWNSAPAVGAPPGWFCVTAGSPGVWAALPNLV